MAKDDLPIGVVPTPLTVMDRNWLRKAVELLRTSLVRSKGKEMEGSEVLALRDKEIAQLNALLSKLA